MKNIILTATAFFTFAAASAQSTRPTTPISARATTTQNVGVSGENPVAPEQAPAKATTATAATTTTTENVQINTNYGKNNDGSSTGTTVTGNGGGNSATPVNNAQAEPGKMIVVPRGK